MKKSRIVVVGLGYVGMSNAVLLSQYNEVIAVDVDKTRVKLVNQKKSTVEDPEISKYLKKKSLNLKALLSSDVSYNDSDYVIIATPTNYDDKTNYFNTDSVETVIAEAIAQKSHATIVIKSTVPVGFTQRMRAKFKSNKILFSPEFLREGKALYDNLHPSRIVVGDNSYEAKIFAGHLSKGALKNNVPIIYMGSTEAEASKLFANTYLAMRVAFFNELDSYSLSQNLNTLSIIESLGHDPRIGNHYNNPSFGYGGYCLPKDTKQLLANYKDIPNNIMQAIVDSNETRKAFVVDEILKTKAKIIGIYRLIMKSDSDNYRDSAILGVIEKLKDKGVTIIIYEPKINQDNIEGLTIIKDVGAFMDMSEIIIANRYHPDLDIAKDKIYSRDIFNKD